MREIEDQIEMLQRQVDFLMDLLDVRMRTVNHLNHRSGETWTSVEFTEAHNSRLKVLEEEIRDLSERDKGLRR